MKPIAKEQCNTLYTSYQQHYKRPNGLTRVTLRRHTNNPKRHTLATHCAESLCQQLRTTQCALHLDIPGRELHSTLGKVVIKVMVTNCTAFSEFLSWLLISVSARVSQSIEHTRSKLYWSKEYTVPYYFRRLDARPRQTH